MFELGNEIYELRYNLKTIETLENTTGKPIVDLIREVPPVSRIKVMLGIALYNSSGNQVSAQRGGELAEEILQKYGLLESFNQSVGKIVEDCGFLFQ
jgi:hypothetical protein